MTKGKKASSVLLLLSSLGLAFADSSDCSTLINTDKESFINQLKVSSASIYQSLHECAQNNFCASYTGSAACLPTLNNYTAYAAYYNAAQSQTASSNTSITIPTAPQPQNQPQESINISPPAYQAPEPTYQTITPPSNTSPEDSSNSDSSGGGIYDGINF